MLSLGLDLKPRISCVDANNHPSYYLSDEARVGLCVVFDHYCRHLSNVVWNATVHLPSDDLVLSGQQWLFSHYLQFLW